MSKRRFSDERDYSRDNTRSYSREFDRFDDRNDRGNDRNDRGNDRNDRGNDRSYDRGYDRGGDRGGDRGFDRNDSWKRQRRGSDGEDGELPKIYSIFYGEVAGIQAYGAFVKIPGVRKQGLVHKSQMARGRVDDPSHIVNIGEKVYCKVISVETSRSGNKIGLSMKTVDQSKGRDLDPENMELGQDERRRRQWFKNERGGGRMDLGAELNTTCRKCGGRGHFANECYSQRDRAYDLLPEDDDNPREYRRDADVSDASKKKKKEKKEKKHKKSKKKAKLQHSDSSSSSEDDSKPAEKSVKKEWSGASASHRRKRHTSSSSNSSGGAQ